MHNWILTTLKKSGVNSKKQVIDKLESLTFEELKKLERDIKLMINLKSM